MFRFGTLISKAFNNFYKIILKIFVVWTWGTRRNCPFDELVDWFDWTSFAMDAVLMIDLEFGLIVLVFDVFVDSCWTDFLFESFEVLEWFQRSFLLVWFDFEMRGLVVFMVSVWSRNWLQNVKSDFLVMF